MEKSHDDHRRGPHRDRQPRSANAVPRIVRRLVPASLHEGAGGEGRPSGGLLDPSAARGEPAQGRPARRDDHRGVRRRGRICTQGRPARTDADDPVRHQAQDELLHRPQGRPARPQPCRRRDHPPRAQGRRSHAGIGHGEHRRDSIGDAAARHHVLDCRVLLTQSRHRGRQGSVAEGRAGRHGDEGTHRLPQRRRARRLRARGTHRRDRRGTSAAGAGGRSRCSPPATGRRASSTRSSWRAASRLLRRRGDHLGPSASRRCIGC